MTPGNKGWAKGAITRDRVEREEARARKEMLLDLANIPDNSTGQFRRRYHYDLPKDDAALLKYRDQLQKVWSRARGTDWALALWLGEATSKSNPAWEVRSFAEGLYGVVPKYSVFPLSVAIGASEAAPQMAICANPECPQSYFLKGRGTQRFCDRPACAAYGQRQHKLKWWKENGEVWKQKWLKTRRSKKPKK